jgi:hypothetical protein
VVLQALAYNFSQKRVESYSLVQRLAAWLRTRADVHGVLDLQDNPKYYYAGDLMIVRRGGQVQFMEVKSEASYTRQTTENMAIERYSSIDKHTSGGPWSSHATYYAHIYADGLTAIMSRYALVAWMERELSQNADGFPFRRIPNEGYTTGAYLVPRARAKAALGARYREYDIVIPS